MLSGGNTDSGARGEYTRYNLSGAGSDSELYELLHVLATQVQIAAIFSDWPATVTFYANCLPPPRALGGGNKQNNPATRGIGRTDDHEGTNSSASAPSSSSSQPFGPSFPWMPCMGNGQVALGYV